MRPIKRNAVGPAVEDVQKRLRLLGYELAVDGEFLDKTEAAVEQFRQKEGLPAGKSVDAQTWSALVDATFALGDRMLYLRMPYFHGHDVRVLQTVLNALGFTTGESDGIFGAHTEHALRDFQSSIGLIDDGVVGPTTIDAINRLRHAWEGKAAVSEIEVGAHIGFARAAEALERLQLCFFGTDDLGRDVAHRAANLAQATTPFSRVSSAEALSVAPPEGTIMVGISSGAAAARRGESVLAFSEDRAFVQRLSTVLTAMEGKSNRLHIQVEAESAQYPGMETARWAQHLAISILDAFCTAIA